MADYCDGYALMVTTEAVRKSWDMTRNCDLIGATAAGNTLLLFEFCPACGIATDKGRPLCKEAP